MSNTVLFDQEAQDKLLKGAETLYRAVSSSLGSRGRNTAIAKSIPGKSEIYERVVIHDGVSIARAIELKDENENMGAYLLREAAQKQVDLVGDGTTVTIVLAYALIKSCLKLMATGVNPMGLRKGLEDGVDKVIKEINKMAKPIKTLEEKVNIATISAEDKELGELVAKTVHDLGEDGVITIEESRGDITIVEKQEGMQLDKGYAHPWFVTNPEKMIASIEDCHVLVTDKALNSIAEMGKFLSETVFPHTKKLLIIAPEVSGDLLTTLIQNKMAGNFLPLAVVAPSFGNNQVEFLQDIAVLTGATLFSKDSGMSFDELDFSCLGFVSKVEANKKSTVLVGGRGSKAEIKLRIRQLKTQLKQTEVDFEREKIKERLGKLTDGIAVIRGGGRTETEMKERKERAIDALAATRAAIKEGIVPGGEVVYLEASKSLGSSVTDLILKEALREPFNKLLTNGGFEPAEFKDKVGKGMGVDVTDGSVKDMVKSGIVDPTAVSTNALRNSVSVCVNLITTSVLIVPEI